MLISRYSSKITEDIIAEFEKANGVELPTRYRTFLKEYNGGDTPKTKFKCGKTASDVRAFYGIGNVRYSLDKLDVHSYVEKSVFPIACDSFGNYILIGLGSNEGRIFFCDHEKGNQIEPISNSFEEFISCCESELISEASKKSIEEREAALVAKGRGHIITDELRKMWQAEIDKYASMQQEEV